MATIRYHPYRHRGIHLPFVEAYPAHQWSSDDSIQADGFLFVDNLKLWTFLVQSVRTGDLFINKVTRPDPGRRKVVDGRLAEELRISTAPAAEGHLLGPLLVRGVMRTYFRELALWQKIRDPTYSCYFKYYNGGTLSDLIDRYNEERRKIPEHFIWHVLLTLIEAVRYLQTGALPGSDDEVDGWNPIYNRALSENNIFLHFPHSPSSPQEPQEGFQSNAFPEVILGGFRHGAIVQISDPRNPTGGYFNGDNVTKDSEDTDKIFSVIKMLCLAHVYRQQYGHVQAPGSFPDDRPYSNDLMNIVRCGESGNYQRRDTQRDNFSDRTRNTALPPGLDYLVNTVLPLAKAKVRRYRRPGGVMPVNWYRKLDVSWTKPTRVMPYEWWPLPENTVDETLPPGNRTYNRNGTESRSNRSNSSPGGSDKENDAQANNNEGRPGIDRANNNQSNNWSSSSPGGSDKENDAQANNNEGRFRIYRDNNNQSNNWSSSSPYRSDEENDDRMIIDEGIPSSMDRVNGNQSINRSIEDQDSEITERPGRDDEEATTIHEPEHTCPEPNPLSNIMKLNGLATLSKFFPDIRPRYRLVMLEYQPPSMSEIRAIPLPRPETPKSPSPTPPQLPFPPVPSMPQPPPEPEPLPGPPDTAAPPLSSSGSSDSSNHPTSSSSSSSSDSQPESSQRGGARGRKRGGRQSRGRGRGRGDGRGDGRGRGRGRWRGRESGREGIDGRVVEGGEQQMEDGERAAAKLVKTLQADVTRDAEPGSQGRINR